MIHGSEMMRGNDHPGKADARQRNVRSVLHIVHRLAVGGLENGVVNLVNRLPENRFSHAVVCITDATDFRLRITRRDVACYELHKRPGLDMSLYVRLWKLLRSIRPDIVHTRNIGTLEYQLIAALAGIKTRIHGEHGRDVTDIDGSNRRYVRLRRALRPLITRYVAVSADIASRLQSQIGVPGGRVVQIYNGVDVDRFQARARIPARGGRVVIGTVGRLQGEKDPLNLISAYREVCRRMQERGQESLLVIIGDGPLFDAVEKEVRDSGLGGHVRMLGQRSDIDACMREMDIFVLPSLTEGISNTILEAMASGLPVVATDVGGNPELVVQDRTGQLVPPSDPAALADAIMRYVDAPDLMRRHGEAGRQRVEEKFSLVSMMDAYAGLYGQTGTPR